MHPSSTQTAAPLPNSVECARPAFDLESFYREHLGFVVAVLRGLGAPHQALRELAHEVFVRVFEDQGAYDPARPIRGWLYGIARNVVREARRAQGKAERHEELTEAVLTFQPDQQSLLEVREQLVVVREALAAIAPERSVVFTMRHALGMTVPEIAAALGGLPEPTVYSRLYAAQGVVEAALARHGRMA